MGSVVQNILTPLIGTVLGSASVFLFRGELSQNVKRALSAFAASVMIVEGIWSLVMPALEQSREMSVATWLPVATGFWLGTLVMLLLERELPRLLKADEADVDESDFTKMLMTTFAMTVHNIPEGMTVGLLGAGAMLGTNGITWAAAVMMAIGVAIENFPEGAIVSLSMHAHGQPKGKSFVVGLVTGILEPFAAVLAIWFTAGITPILPYFLAFGAGSMFYVAIGELIPESAEGTESKLGTLVFAAGFTLMIALNVIFES